MALTLYRIVLSDPPTRLDFESYEAQGRKPPRGATSRLLEMWSGVSTYDSKEAARAWAVQRPRLGRFIATLQIEDGAAIRIEKTGNDPHHYDLWGDPAEMLARVVAVETV